MVYPNDDTGDALRRLEADGDDLSRSRDIAFSVSFPNERAAEMFAEYFRSAGYETTTTPAEVKESHSWDVVVVRHMLPTYGSIAAFEEELQEVANTLGGQNDGWGCFSQ